MTETKVDYEALIAKAREEASVADCWLCRSYLNQLANALEAHREALRHVVQRNHRHHPEGCSICELVDTLLEPKP